MKQMTRHGERTPGANRCALHANCASADAAAKSDYAAYRRLTPSATHCALEGCAVCAAHGLKRRIG